MIRVVRHIVATPIFVVGYVLLWIAIRIDGEARSTARPDSGTAKFHERGGLIGNRATYNGQPFWIGQVDPRDSHIEAVYTWEQAEAEDFHHTMYMRPELLDREDEDGSIAVFWIEANGTVGSFWRDGELPRDVVDRILTQIEVMLP